MENKISYWFVPREEERTYFQSLINQLAEKYGTLPFTPHLTLYVGEDSPQDDPIEIVDSVIRGILPISLEVDKIRYSDEITKTLYVSFYPHEMLSKIHNNLRNQLSIASDYRLDPHVSLIYYPLLKTEKQLLVEAIRIQTPVVVFDEVWAVSTPEVNDEKVEVGRWKIIYKRLLPGN